jgi:hypothetical protein
MVFVFSCLAALAGVFGGALSTYAACSNPSPMPTGYASPCPVFSLSANSVSQSQTLTLSAIPQPGTDYIYTTAYYAAGSQWLPTTLIGNNIAPSYSTSVAQGYLTPTILSTLPLGTNYLVLWDWLWDATAGCYKGPGLNQCNTGQWRIQSFTITATYAYSQSTYYAYSQASYYAYSQSSYTSYTYSQSAYAGGTITAASCSSTDVQNAINLASAGDTVMLPACSGVTWSSGAVTVSGKALTLMGQTTCSYTSVTLSGLTGNVVNTCTDNTSITLSTLTTNDLTRMWYAKNIKGNAADTITCNFGSSFNPTAIIVLQYSGADPVAPLDAKATGVVKSSAGTL